MKKRTAAITVAAALTVGIILGVFIGNFRMINVSGGKENFQYTQKMGEILKIIDENYVGEADKDAMTNIAYKALVETAGDRWSFYMNKEEYQQYKIDQTNQYTGIGVTFVVDEENKTPLVTEIIEDSAAQNAGIEIGDHLIAIDGVELEGKTAAEVKEEVKSKAENQFSIKLLKPSGEEKDVTLKSGKIFAAPVKYELMEDNIGYVRIKNFDGESGSMIVEAVDDLIEKNAKGIVFDVRNNPGGFLHEMVEALDHLIPEGDLFVSVDKKGEEFVIKSDADCVKIPMAVLINENTYSAAEFFAAALSEYELAEVVGQRSTGKSRLQVNIETKDGGAVHLSTKGYLTPNRVDLAKQGGFEPDKSVELDEKSMAYLIGGRLPHDKDAQLIEARNILLK